MRLPRSLTVIALPLVVLVATASGAVAGSAQDREPDVAPSAVPDRSSVGFPDVPGVDLAALGYDGVRLDGIDLDADILAGLPTGPLARARVLADRLDSLIEQQEGLAAAEELLGAVVRELGPAIAVQRRDEAVTSDRLEEVNRRVRSVQRRIRRHEHVLEDQRDRLTESIVAAYVHPPDADTIGAVLDTGATSTAQLAAPVLHGAKVDHDLALEDRLEVAVATLQGRLATLRDLETELTTRHQTAVTRLADMVERRDAHFEAVNRTRMVQHEVGSRLELVRAELDDIAQSLSEAGASLAADARNRADLPLTVVEGIRVHVTLATQLEAMLAEARADGIVLRGWGHRSHERQIKLREAHCGPTPEDVWLKPSSECSPPTAVPGKSMHELGLAVDFTHDGSAISSRDSPAFRWLAENAAAYGFRNLPSEPWHWSVNGA